jgi:adenosine deaminase
VSDLSSTRDCNRMADLIFRVVLHASRQADKLLISLAGEQTNFRRLYTLSPEQIRQLKDRHIGTDTDMAAQELAWLQALPKADLYCHFGGILSIEEMIEAASAEAENIAARCGTDPEFLSWNNQIQTAVKYRNTEFLADQMAGSGEALRHMFGQVPEPLSVCAFLLAFEAVPALLDELAEDEFCRFQLIFIASRHGAMEKIQQHIYLARSLAESNPVFKDHFSGFDLAGAESAKKPAELRDAFLPLMEQCVQFTIHAGEDEPVENIWQAVYHLSADRIGHGLTLKKNPDLMNRFIDRKIVLELCPSSNFQIVGFQDPALGRSGEIYPLEKYLAAGVKVTVNTDDPGMSRTSLSREYLKAARMAENGLSCWDILQLIRNSFRAAFAPHKVKGDCLIRAENRIMDIVSRPEGVLKLRF